MQEQEAGRSLQKGSRAALINSFLEFYSQELPPANKIYSSRIVYENPPHLTLVEATVDEKASNNRVPYSITEKQSYVHLILRQHNSILMQFRHRIGCAEYILGLPGGGIEEEETPCDAVTREAEEELGIQLREPRDLGTFMVEPGRSSQTVTYFYSVIKQEKSLNPRSFADLEQSLFLFIEMEKLYEYRDLMSLSSLYGLSLI